MRFKLIPTNDAFFGMFIEAAENAAECARRLRGLLDDLTQLEAGHRSVVECERKGDVLTKAMLTKMNSSFVTPFDREDIHSLVEKLDDVCDDILGVSDLLTLIQVDEALPELVEMADILVRMTQEACGMFQKLESMRGVQEYLDNIDKMESEGDSVYRRTLARLFRDYDALSILKWKDVIQEMEKSLNTVEDISNIVEAVVLKHA
jgi:predicted phosphate transport protein (TIGR00153 family)